MFLKNKQEVANLENRFRSHSEETSAQMFHVRRDHVSFFAFHLFLVEFHRNVKIKSGAATQLLRLR